MAGTELKLDIGEGQIRNAIAVAIAESFTGEMRDKLLRDIIRAHLQYKESSYDKETLLSKTIGKLVREIAKDEIEKTIERLAPQIRSVVQDTLGDGFAESVLQQLKFGLANKMITAINVNVHLKDEEERELRGY